MRIRLLTCLSGSEFVWNLGDVVDHEDAESRRLIAAGIAEAVEAPKPKARKAPAFRAETAAAPDDVETR